MTTMILVTRGGGANDLVVLIDEDLGDIVLEVRVIRGGGEKDLLEDVLLNVIELEPG